jgi:hypothetical protein
VCACVRAWPPPAASVFAAARGAAACGGLGPSASCKPLPLAQRGRLSESRKPAHCYGPGEAPLGTTEQGSYADWQERIERAKSVWEDRPELNRPGKLYPESYIDAIDKKYKIVELINAKQPIPLEVMQLMIYSFRCTQAVIEEVPSSSHSMATRILLN